MGAPEIEAFLSYLAQEANISASTQNQAFNALLFLYRNVLQIELATPIHALSAKHAQRLPTVLSKTKVNQVLSGMQGLHQLMARLLYGCGLRLMECLRLRVKDIDFEQSQVAASEGIKMSKRPWFTLMRSFADRRQCAAHWMNDAFGSGLLLHLPGLLSLHRPCQATLELAQIVLPNKTFLMKYQVKTLQKDLRSK